MSNAVLSASSFTSPARAQFGALPSVPATAAGEGAEEGGADSVLGSGSSDSSGNGSSTDAVSPARSNLTAELAHPTSSARKRLFAEVTFGEEEGGEEEMLRSVFGAKAAPAAAARPDPLARARAALDAAQDALFEAETSVDAGGGEKARRVAKAELRVAKAKLDLADTELRVAQDELRAARAAVARVRTKPDAGEVEVLETQVAEAKAEVALHEAKITVAEAKRAVAEVENNARAIAEASGDRATAAEARDVAQSQVAELNESLIAARSKRARTGKPASPSVALSNSR